MKEVQFYLQDAHNTRFAHVGRHVGQGLVQGQLNVLQNRLQTQIADGPKSQTAHRGVLVLTV